MSYPKQPGSGTESGYNGWKNYETWNVALWICNDEGLYSLGRQFRYQGYKALVKYLLELNNPNDYTIHQIAFETPDNVSWNSPELDIEALDAMLKEL